MKQLFDDSSFACSKLITQTYSTSFSLAVNMLSPSIRPAIYSIYGFVRYADEIVDSFHHYDKGALIDKFEQDYYQSHKDGISLNPILNSFQQTVHKYQIKDELIQAFLRSMKMDLHKKDYLSQEEYEAYIYGSANVVGLMCLAVFVKGDESKYQALKPMAMRLGSAFQKVNFLRDLKQDIQDLDRSYFPNVDLRQLNPYTKAQIIQEIEADFTEALKGIKRLPIEARFGVYTAYLYYKSLLKKLKQTHASEIMNKRIRVSDPLKLLLLCKSYLQCQFNLLRV